MSAWLVQLRQLLLKKPLMQVTAGKKALEGNSKPRQKRIQSPSCPLIETTAFLDQFYAISFISFPSQELNFNQFCFLKFLALRKLSEQNISPNISHAAFSFLNSLRCNETEREMVEPSKLMMRVRFPPPACFSH